MSHVFPKGVAGAAGVLLHTNIEYWVLVRKLTRSRYYNGCGRDEPAV